MTHFGYSTEVKGKQFFFLKFRNNDLSFIEFHMSNVAIKQFVCNRGILGSHIYFYNKNNTFTKSNLHSFSPNRDERWEDDEEMDRGVE